MLGAGERAGGSAQRDQCRESQSVFIAKSVLGDVTQRAVIFLFSSPFHPVGRSILPMNESQYCPAAFILISVFWFTRAVTVLCYKRHYLLPPLPDVWLVFFPVCSKVKDKVGSGKALGKA